MLVTCVPNLESRREKHLQKHTFLPCSLLKKIVFAYNSYNFPHPQKIENFTLKIEIVYAYLKMQKKHFGIIVFQEKSEKVYRFLYLLIV